LQARSNRAKNDARSHDNPRTTPKVAHNLKIVEFKSRGHHVWNPGVGSCVHGCLRENSPHYSPDPFHQIAGFSAAAAGKPDATPTPGLPTQAGEMRNSRARHPKKRLKHWLGADLAVFDILLALPGRGSTAVSFHSPQRPH